MLSSSSSSSMEICYNPYCKNVRPEPSRRGWRLRNGDFAQLCDRCAYVFEEGRFCETFHSDAAGWRTCESCRKRIHCGCIVSVHTFALLDFGGVSCIACAKKNIIMPPKHRSTLSPFLHSPELVRDLSIKNCNPIAGHSLASGQWRHTFNIWNPPCIQSESHPRMRYEVDGIKLISEDSFATTTDNKKLEKPCDRAYGSLNLGGTDRLANENATGVDLVAAFNGMRKGEGNHDGLQGSNPHAGEKDLIGTRRVGLAGPGYMPFSGITHEPPIRSVVNDSVHASSSKGDQSHPPPSATVPAVPISSSNDGSNLNEVSREQSQQQTIQLPVTQEFNASIPPNGRDPSDKTQVHNGRLRADARGRSPLQPRYWPRVTDQELQQISGDTNSVITPLFEKMLSASDAGKIGRLVLPKKCAEAYLPTISQPEGVPLKVQDAKGQEWVFQFRFWPNNNSRMYVLEGVTPCIHSMQLQAGDIVTFSRLDPGGKLVMGFRKASSIRQADQDSPSQRTSNNVSKDSEVNPADAANTLSKDKSSYIAKNVSGAESCVHSGKRKVRTVGPKGKRLRIETEESEKINLTWEEAQEMLRPPPNHVPSLVIIDDQEIEEYEEPPILGKPTISSIDSEGSENVQWVQCGDCNKWRKLPSYTLLPPRWTCSVNSYDSTRSSCSSAQEITAEQLKDMLSSTESGSISKKVRAAKRGMNVVESSDGLKTLANLAILVEDETEPPSQPTTRHPRHRPGCTCIVCIQPPSGKGPKHKDTCTCTVCLMVKRRFQTQMLRREKRQSEKEAETARKKLQQLHLPETPEQCDGASLAINTRDIDLPATSPTGECDAHQKMMVNNNTDDYDPNDKKPSNSPCKVGIDLNMQPEREDADSCSMTSNGDLVVDQVESEGAQDIGGSGSFNSDDAEGKAEDQLRLPNEHHIHAGLEAQVTQCDSKSAAVTTQ